MPRSYGVTNVAPWATAPAIGSKGDTYFNTTDGLLYVVDVNGTSWRPWMSSSDTAWKLPARVATTANITTNGTQTIDGTAVVVGDRVLVRAQTSAATNGIYVVASGAWARASDCDTAARHVGAVVVVREGTTLANTAWQQTTDPPITLGSTAITWAALAAGGGTAEVNISTAGPSPRVGEVLWVDTDESWGTRVESLEVVGPWPLPTPPTTNVAYKADVLVAWSASWYSGAAGMSYVALMLDGVVQNGWAGFFFNEASSHKEASGGIVIRGLAAGSHSWNISPQTNVNSDANDRGHIALTFVAVP